MNLNPPVEQYLSGSKPTHSIRPKLHEHITFLRKDEVTTTLVKAGFLTEDGKVSKKAQLDGLVDVCDGKVLWNISATKKALLSLTRRPSSPSKKPAAVVPQSTGPSRPNGPIWTDLDSIGTYFGVGKVKIGKWLDELGLRALPKKQRNESGDYDMLDMAWDAKEKQAVGFNAKKPTEKALEYGYAKIETIEYTKKGETKSFDKITWNLDLVKNVLVKAGHPLDTERKMLLKPKGRNGEIKVSSIDDRVEKIYADWRKAFLNPTTRDKCWEIVEKQPRAILTRLEMRLGYPDFFQKRLYLKPENLDKIISWL